MNNKGFTLVELLGVVIILIIVGLLVFPAVTNIIVKSRKTSEKAQLTNIYEAAYNLSLQNLSNLPKKGEYNCVSLAELKSNGLIDFNIKNPKTLNRYPDNLMIKITNVGPGYKNDNDRAKVYGNYLYEIVDSTESLNISFSGVEKDSIYGDYIAILELNSTFNIIPSVNSNEKIIKYFTLNNEVVEGIDTSISNVYKAYYTAVDSNCNASSEVLTIIISDTTKPTIEIANNINIGTNTTSLNLKEGVTCTDNSDYCTITYTSDIRFGEKGKYIVNYTATDPSGNYSTKKRVVNIK